MKYCLKSIFLLFLFLSTLTILNAQDFTIDKLSREGARIGRQFKVAIKEGDIDAQNAALDEISAILSTLKKQEQVDALTNAFNNCNVTISTPSRDAVGYTMALGNAIVDEDTIGIEDANDIIETARQQYANRSADEQALFDKYLCAAKVGLELGLKALDANGNIGKITAIESQLSAEYEKHAGDSVSIKIINDMYGIFSIKITDIETDAKICATEIINASAKGGVPSQMEKAKNLCGAYFKKYSLQKGDEEAKRLNDRVNEILEGNIN